MLSRNPKLLSTALNIFKVNDVTFNHSQASDNADKVLILIIIESNTNSQIIRDLIHAFADLSLDNL